MPKEIFPSWEKELGGFSEGVPPLPIPNREVKPLCADGTGQKSGRVGRRLFFQKPCTQ